MKKIQIPNSKFQTSSRASNSKRDMALLLTGSALEFESLKFGIYLDFGLWTLDFRERFPATFTHSSPC
jgi:hypothetical protein